MPRRARIAPGGMVFHVLNRGVGRRRLFEKAADYAAFEAIVVETLEKCPLRISGYCLMPNHWHFVLWPQGDGDPGAFMQRLCVTHVTRWQKHRQVVGEGRGQGHPCVTRSGVYAQPTEKCAGRTRDGSQRPPRLAGSRGIPSAD